MLGTITGILLIIFTIGASQAVDIGGGPQIILILMFLLDFPLIFFVLGILKMLMPILYLILASTSLVTIGMGVNRTHPITKKYLMDYEIIGLALPVVASGAFFGVLAKNLVSEMVLVTFQVFLMVYLIYQACKVDRHIFTNDNFQMFNGNMNVSTHDGINIPLVPIQAKNQSNTYQNTQAQPQSPQNQKIPANPYPSLQNQPQYAPPNTSNLAAQSNQAQPYPNPNPYPNPYPNPNPYPQTNYNYYSQRRQQQDVNPELQKILEQEANRMPKSKGKVLGYVLLYTLVLFVIKSATQMDLVVVNPDINIPDDFTQDDHIVVNFDNKRILHPYKKCLTITQSLSVQQFQYLQLVKQYILPNPALNFGLTLPNLSASDQQSYNPMDYTMGFKSCFLGTSIALLIHITLSYLSSKSVAIQTASLEVEKQKYGYVYVKESDKMSSNKMWNCMISGFFGGLAVGMFGVGASVALVGTWIGVGVDQDTAITSSAPITLFASIICILLSSFQGYYAPYNLAYLLIISILSFLITITTYVVFQKLNNNSYNFSKLFIKRIKLILWIGGLILLVLYYMLQSTFNEKYFTDFGVFC